MPDRTLTMLPDTDNPGTYLVLADARVEARGLTVRQATTLLDLLAGQPRADRLGAYTLLPQGDGTWWVYRNGQPVGSAQGQHAALGLAAASLEDEAAAMLYRMAAYYGEVREAAMAVLDQAAGQDAGGTALLGRLADAVAGTAPGAALLYDVLAGARRQVPTSTQAGASLHEALRALAALDRTALRGARKRLRRKNP